LLLDLKEDGLDAALNILDCLGDKLFKLAVLPQHLVLGLEDGLLHFADIEVEGSETIQVLLRIVDDQLQGPYFVVAVGLVVANAADNALVDALGLDADQVEHLTCMVVAFGAFGVVELVRHLF